MPQIQLELAFEKKDFVGLSMLKFVDIQQWNPETEQWEPVNQQTKDIIITWAAIQTETGVNTRDT